MPPSHDEHEHLLGRLGLQAAADFAPAHFAPAHFAPAAARARLMLLE